MLVESLKGSETLKKKIYAIGQSRANEIFQKINSYLAPQESILDVGSGICAVAEVLMEHGFDTIAMDISDRSMTRQIVPIIYDGKKFPFEDNSFDSVLILDVLHHCPNPDLILAEAKRVSKKNVIIMENIHSNILNKLITILMDRVVNLDFGKLNHRQDSEWKKTFSRTGLKLIEEKKSKFWLLFTSKVYHLGK